MALTPAQIEGMRSVVADAIDLFAKNRKRVAHTHCFSDQNADWQLSLSDALTKQNTPNLKNCGANEAVFFFRMTETFEDEKDVNKDRPRVFLAGILASSTGMKDVPFVFQLWPALMPDWRGNDDANARSNRDDVPVLSNYISHCLDEVSVNQMPKLDDEDEEHSDDDDGSATADETATASQAVQRDEEEGSEDSD